MSYAEQLNMLLERKQQEQAAKQAAVNDPANIFLTPEQAAKVLSVSVNTLSVWRSRGGGPEFFRIGRGRGAIRYKLSSLLDYAGEPRNNTAQA